MATDVRVVTPDDLGDSLRLGVLTAGKIDVDVSKLDLPPTITGLTLSGTELNINTTNGTHTVDLSPMLPNVVADVFLKGVSVNNDYKLVFTVGKDGDTTEDITLEADLRNYFTLEIDSYTLSGTGRSGDPLKVFISSEDDNLLEETASGLYISRHSLNIPEPDIRDIRLTNASGTTVLGYIHSTEQ